MDRREFIASAAALAGITISSYGQSTAASPLKVVESANLTLSPKTSDQWEARFKPKRSLRLLHVTDTHFSSTNERDVLTVRTLDALVRTTNPDMIVHTGDFVDNDSEDPVSWRGVEFFNGLKRPWALCFGNHDYPVEGARGSLSLEEFHQSLRNSAMGYFQTGQTRLYCYRHDLFGQDDDQPAVTLCYFQVGYATGDRKISTPQLDWFSKQLRDDKAKGWKHPILVFVHIPLLQYEQMATAAQAAGGFKNEKVHFDSDTGENFKIFVASKRVTGIFCGHDHLNNYFGNWEGIGLHYGRVSGWGGYGKRWARGGRMITIQLTNGRFTHREFVV